MQAFPQPFQGWASSLTAPTSTSAGAKACLGCAKQGQPAAKFKSANVTVEATGGRKVKGADSRGSERELGRSFQCWIPAWSLIILGHEIRFRAPLRSRLQSHVFTRVLWMGAQHLKAVQTRGQAGHKNGLRKRSCAPICREMRVCKQKQGEGNRKELGVRRMQSNAGATHVSVQASWTSLCLLSAKYP